MQYVLEGYDWIGADCHHVNYTRFIQNISKILTKFSFPPSFFTLFEYCLFDTYKFVCMCNSLEISDRLMVCVWRCRRDGNFQTTTDNEYVKCSKINGKICRKYK